MKKTALAMLFLGILILGTQTVDAYEIHCPAVRDIGMTEQNGNFFYDALAIGQHIYLTAEFSSVKLSFSDFYFESVTIGEDDFTCTYAWNDQEISLKATRIGIARQCHVIKNNRTIEDYFINCPEKIS